MTRRRRWILAGGLVLFAQVFQYVIDVPPLYLLTKAWPLIALPFALWGMARLDLPYRGLLLLTLAWVLVVAPFMGMAVLGIDGIGATATTAKVWALLTGFALPAFLAWLRPPREALARTILWLGAATWAAFPILWLAPERLYLGGLEGTKIFLWDEARGHHLYIPLVFGLMALFHVARGWRGDPRWWRPVLVVLAFAALLYFYKVRLPILAAGVAIGAGQLLSRPMRPLRVGLAIPLALAAAVPVMLYAASGGASQQLGSSLEERQREAGIAVAWLDAHPFAWVMGSGNATRIGDKTLGDIVGDFYFFTADIGWLGVIFEYGLIGTALIAALLVTTLVVTWRASADGDPLTGLTFDYTVYFAVATLTTPVVFAPGELMCCLALATWLNPLAAARTSASPSGYPAATGSCSA